MALFDGEPRLTITNDETESLPILTLQHKNRCPLCSSKKCFQYDGGVRPKGIMYIGNLEDNIALTFSKCSRTGKYFCHELSGQRESVKRNSCGRCGSKEINELEKFILSKKANEDMPNNDKIKIVAAALEGTLIIYVCKQCGFYTLHTTGFRNKSGDCDDEFITGIPSVERILSWYRQCYTMRKVI